MWNSILKIYPGLLCEILRNSFIQCGLVSSDTREYHNQLRHFVQNFDDLTDDDRTSDIPAFNPDPHKELREGHPELMDSEEDLMDIQSEDEDEDYN